jgi:HD superfamily phosphohydrolase
VVEAKGIYSIENFLTSRRLMYWQVYLHKTAVAAEKMIINVFRRAKELSTNGEKLFAPPALAYFLENDIHRNSFSDEALHHFTCLDDNDIWCSLKVWSEHPNRVLSMLSRSLINRQLFKIAFLSKPKTEEEINKCIEAYVSAFNLSAHEAAYFVSSDSIATNMYNEADDSIGILYNDGTVKDISEASDMLNLDLLSKKIEKYYFAYLNPNER